MVMMRKRRSVKERRERSAPIKSEESSEKRLTGRRRELIEVERKEGRKRSASRLGFAAGSSSFSAAMTHFGKFFSGDLRSYIRAVPDQACRKITSRFESMVVVLATRSPSFSRAHVLLLPSLLLLLLTTTVFHPLLPLTPPENTVPPTSKLA